MSDSITTNETRTGKSLRGVLVVVALLAGVGCAIFGMQSPRTFWAGYLVAVVFWLGTSLGCLGTALIHGTSGGRWGRAAGRALNAGMGTILFSLIAAWIMAFGAAAVFPWAGNESQRAVLGEHQKIWLAPAAVALRFAVMSVIWLGMGIWLRGRYKAEAREPGRRASARLSAIGLIVFFVTVSIASIDFMMSLTPHWASSMYPLIRILSCGVAGMSAAILGRAFWLTNPTREDNERSHDLGNLLQAFNMMWTYLAFSQYLLIWAGDISGEVEYYVDRRTPVWSVVAIGLFLFHFVVPFLLLLSRPLKRSRKKLSGVAVLLLVMCLIEGAWAILPSCPVDTGPAILAMLLSVVAVGCLWIVVFQWSFLRLPALTELEVQHVTHAPEAVPSRGESA